MFVYTLLSGQITPEESLFTYPVGTDAASFAHPEHVPVFLSDVIASASQEILDTCGNDVNCIFDYAETDNPEVGLSTMMIAVTNEMEALQACECS